MSELDDIALKAQHARLKLEAAKDHPNFAAWHAAGFFDPWYRDIEAYQQAVRVSEKPTRTTTTKRSK